MKTLLKKTLGNPKWIRIQAIEIISDITFVILALLIGYMVRRMLH